MSGRKLTKKQTELIRGIISEMSKRLNRDITITDLLNVCASAPCLDLITDRLMIKEKIENKEI
jgi:hypothetical protein